MAREYSRTNVTIWQDNDWRAVPFPAQHVYRMLWDHPQLSYCGVVDWRPAKLSAWSVGLDKELLADLTDCLRARHFIVVDEETEECLVRSWVRWDGLIRQPRLAVSFANAYAAVGSNTLRGVIIHEMNKLHEREPDAAGWHKPGVQAMFGLPEIDAKSLPTPADPFEDGFAFTLGSVSSPVSEAFRPNASERFGSVSLPPTPAPTPAPISNSHQVDVSEDVNAPASATAAEIFDDFWTRYPKKVGKGAARKAFTSALKRVSDPWEIINGARVFAVTNTGTDPRFIAHPATWLNADRWLDEPDAAPPEAPDGGIGLPHVDDLETPPDGLTDAEWSEWDRGYRERLRAKRLARQAGSR